MVLGTLSADALVVKTTQALISPNDFMTLKVKKRDLSMAIAAEVVIYKLQQKQTITLVDVRCRKSFERLHIPGSINIPLHAVKTKTFLKSSLLVLINGGFHYSLLENACRQIQDLGFKARILDGGLPAWKRKGGRLAGDQFALREMQTIAPRVFFQEKAYENNLIIDISAVQSQVAGKLLPHSRHLPVTVDQAEWARKLSRIIKNHKNQPFLSILVLNESGDGYDRLDKTLAGMPVNTFYLQGGIAGYEQYLENLIISRRPLDSRIKSNKTCRACSEGSEENIPIKVHK